MRPVNRRFLWGFVCLSAVCCLCAHPLQAAPRLIGWWPMNDAPGAATLADASGNGRHCTLGPNVTMVAGRFGNAASFDGTGGAWASFASPLMTNMTFAWVFMEDPHQHSAPNLQIGRRYLLSHALDRLGTFSFGLPAATTGAPASNDPFKFVPTAGPRGDCLRQGVHQLHGPLWSLHLLHETACARRPVRKASATTSCHDGFLGQKLWWLRRRAPLNGMLDDVRFSTRRVRHRSCWPIQNTPPSADGARIRPATATPPASRRMTCLTSSCGPGLGDAWSVVSAPPGATPAIAIPHILDTDVPLSAPALTSSGSRLNRVRHRLGRRHGHPRAGDPHPASRAVPSAFWNAPVACSRLRPARARLPTRQSQPGPPALDQGRGPGAVFFDNPSPHATAAFFSNNGTYVVGHRRRRRGQDSDDITVTSPRSRKPLLGIEHWWRLNDDPASRQGFR
jgi:hypothetical protein